MSNSDLLDSPENVRLGHGNLATVRAYFLRLDAGDSTMLELFSTDFQFYYPKFGIGHGPAEFQACAAGIYAAFPVLRHDSDLLLLHASGSNIVVAEGTTSGTDAMGRNWQGGQTPGGRFCSVFEFAKDGLIKRMSIYTDPDYSAEDQARFRWGAQRNW